MTKNQMQEVNAELLAACQAALDRFKAISTDHADVRTALASAIGKATTPPSRWYILETRKRAEDPFAKFQEVANAGR